MPSRLRSTILVRSTRNTGNFLLLIQANKQEYQQKGVDVGALGCVRHLVSPFWPNHSFFPLSWMHLSWMHQNCSCFAPKLHMPKPNVSVHGGGPETPPEEAGWFAGGRPGRPAVES
jgi:hypothetical protein